MKRVPGLDGLRAISILLVLCGHLVGTQGFYNNLAAWDRIGDIANLGVRVFFVISGYLITLLLLREVQKTGTISIKQFYYRRTLRIFPASYSFVVFLTVASLFGWLTLHRGDLWHAYTYTMNYFPDRSWWVGHLWSLSVEEQFYLLWPATLLFLGTRKGLKAAVAVVLLVPIIRVGTFYLWPSQVASIGNSFQTVADAIATGCVLAGYKDALLNKKWFQRIMNSNWFFLIPLAIFAVNARGGARLRWALLETLINVMIALCVCRATIHTQDFAGRVLNWPPLAFVGVLSYSLYLWQQPFIDRASTLWIARFPQNLILAFCAALLCHYAIEKPFLSLRDAKRVRRAPSTEVPQPVGSMPVSRSAVPTDALTSQARPVISQVSESPADG